MSAATSRGLVLVLRTLKLVQIIRLPKGAKTGKSLLVTVLDTGSWSIWCECSPQACAPHHAGPVPAGGSEVHSLSVWPEVGHEDDRYFIGLCRTGELSTSCWAPTTSVLSKLP